MIFMKRIFTLLLMTPLVCSADWFGPKTYEDCVLEGMKGTTSDVAAQEIRKACRSKFPQKAISFEIVNADSVGQFISNAELSKIPETPFLRPSANFKVDHKIKFHNSSQKNVVYMTLAILVNDSKSPRLFRKYVGAEPRSTNEGLYEFQLSSNEKITSWWVHELEVRNAD